MHPQKIQVHDSKARGRRSSTRASISNIWKQPKKLQTGDIFNDHQTDYVTASMDTVVLEQADSSTWKHQRGLTGLFLHLQLNILVKAGWGRNLEMFFNKGLPFLYWFLLWIQLSAIILSQTLALIPPTHRILAYTVLHPSVIGPSIYTISQAFLLVIFILLLSIYLTLANGHPKAPHALTVPTSYLVLLVVYPLFIPLQLSFWMAIESTTEPLWITIPAVFCMIIHLAISWFCTLNVSSFSNHCWLHSMHQYLDPISQVCWAIIVATIVPTDPTLQQILYFVRIFTIVFANVILHLLQPYRHTPNRVLSAFYMSLAWGIIGDLSWFGLNLPVEQMLALHIFPYLLFLMVGWLTLRKSSKRLELPITLYRVLGRLQIPQDPVHTYLLLLEDTLTAQSNRAKFANFLNQQQNFNMANEFYRRIGVSDANSTVLQIEQALFWWKTDCNKEKWLFDNMHLDFAFRQIPNCVVVAIDKRIEEAKVLMLAWNRWLDTKGCKIIHTSIPDVDHDVVPRYLIKSFPFSLSHVLCQFAGSKRQMQLSESNATAKINKLCKNLTKHNASILKFIMLPDVFAEPDLFTDTNDEAVASGIAEAVVALLNDQLNQRHSQQEQLYRQKLKKNGVAHFGDIFDDATVNVNFFPIVLMMDMFQRCDPLSLSVLQRVVNQLKNRPVIVIYHFEGIHRKRSIALRQVAEQMQAYPDVGSTFDRGVASATSRQALPLIGPTFASTVRVETHASTDVARLGELFTDAGHLDGTGVTTHSNVYRDRLSPIDDSAGDAMSRSRTGSRISPGVMLNRDRDNSLLTEPVVEAVSMTSSGSSTRAIPAHMLDEQEDGVFQSPSGTVVQVGRARSLSTTWNEVCSSPRMTRSHSMIGSRDTETASLQSSASADTIPMPRTRFHAPCSLVTVTRGSMADACMFCAETNILLGTGKPGELPKKTREGEYDQFACLEVLSNVVFDMVNNDPNVIRVIQLASCLVKDVMTVSMGVLIKVCARYESILDDEGVPKSISNGSLNSKPNLQDSEFMYPYNPSVSQTLLLLLRLKLFKISRDTVYDDLRLMFSSFAIREAMFASIPVEHKTKMHRVCALVYQHMRSSDYMNFIQMYLHLERSSDPVPTLPVVVEFVEDLVHRSLYQIAISHGRLGLDLVDEILEEEIDVSEIYDLRALKFSLCLFIAKSAGRASDFRLANRMINTAEDLMSGNRETANVCTVKSELAYLEGFFDLAEETTRQGLERIWFLRDRTSKTRLMRQLGQALHMEKQYDLSVFWFEDALRVARRIDAVQEEAKCLLGLSQVQADIGELQSAEQNLGMCMRLFQFESNQHWMAQAGLHFGRLYLLSGNTVGARLELGKVLSLASDLNMNKVVGDAGLLLLDTALLVGDTVLFDSVVRQLKRSHSSLGNLQFELGLRLCRKMVQDHIDELNLFAVENDLHLRSSKSQKVRLTKGSKATHKMQQTFSINPFNRLKTVDEMEDVVKILKDAESFLDEVLGEGNVLIQASLFLQSTLVTTVIGQMESRFRETADGSIDLCAALTSYLALEMINGSNGSFMERRNVELRALCVYMRVVDDIPWDIYKGKTCCSGRQITQWFQNAFLCSVETASSLALTLQGEHLLVPVLKRSTFDRTKFKFYFMEDNKSKMFSPTILDDLFEQMTARSTSLPFTKYKGERCFTGRHCVDWIIAKWLDVEFASVASSDMRVDIEDVESMAAGDSALRSAEQSIKQNERKALTSRKKAIQMAQQLLDGGYIKNMGDEEVFVDSDRTFYLSLKKRQKRFSMQMGSTPHLNRVLNGY